MTDPVQPQSAATQMPVAASSAAGALSRLKLGIAAAAPQADAAGWASALAPWLLKSDIVTPLRIAALLGQCAVEAGTDFGELVENLNYTHAGRLCAVYPDEFPTLADAAPFVGNPTALANRVYADRCGNGNEASGDGARFVGRGLIQITGREDYVPFAAWCGKSLDDASAWAETRDGAAASACWYWDVHQLNKLADGWLISRITRAINGAAMEANGARITASNLAFHALNQ